MDTFNVGIKVNY